jgi:hypothetical protein
MGGEVGWCLPSLGVGQIAWACIIANSIVPKKEQNRFSFYQHEAKEN